MGRYDNIIVPASGQKLSRSQFGQPVKDAITDIDTRLTNALPSATRCRAYNNAGLTLADGVLTLVPLQAESWKAPTSMHSTSVNNSRMIAPVNGLYNIDGLISYAAGGTAGRRVFQIRKNAAGSPSGGTQLININNQAAATSGTTVGWNGDLVLLQNDYVEVFALQLSGGTVPSPVGGEFSTYLGMRLVDFA